MFRRKHVAKFAGRTSPASVPARLKKPRIYKNVPFRIGVTYALNTKAEPFPQEMRSCATVDSVQRWRFSASVSQLRRLLPLQLGGPTPVVAATPVTLTRLLTPGSIATAGPTVRSVTPAAALTVTRPLSVTLVAADTVPPVTRRPRRMATVRLTIGTAVVGATCTVMVVMPWRTRPQRGGILILRNRSRRIRLRARALLARPANAKISCNRRGPRNHASPARRLETPKTGLSREPVRALDLATVA